jgi:cytochrome c-type biogenesis protein CcmH/NrfG
MEGIQKVRQVTEKDSTNLFAQLVLGHGSVISGQYDKAIDRFERVIRLKPENLEAMVMLGEVNERKGDKGAAVLWYSRATGLTANEALKSEIQSRINELKK